MGKNMELLWWYLGVPSHTTKLFGISISGSHLVSLAQLLKHSPSHPPSTFALPPSLPISLIQGLWLGTSAGIMKTVPKYMTAVVVKDKVNRI